MQNKIHFPFVHELVLVFFVLGHGIGFLFLDKIGFYLFGLDVLLVFGLILKWNILLLFFPVELPFYGIIFGVLLSNALYAGLNFLVSHQFEKSILIFQKLSVSFLFFYLLCNHSIVRKQIRKNKILSEIKNTVQSLFLDFKKIQKRNLRFRDKLVLFLRMNIKKL